MVSCNIWWNSKAQRGTCPSSGILAYLENTHTENTTTIGKNSVAYSYLMREN